MAAISFHGGDAYALTLWNIRPEAISASQNEDRPERKALANTERLPAVTRESGYRSKGAYVDVLV